VPSGIGLVVLDYDQAPVTRRCLASVAAGSRPDEIVLVENGGPPVDLDSDPTLAELAVTVIRRERNIGAAAARNLAFGHLAEKATVERFVLLDNDTIVAPDFFELVAGSSLERFEIAAPLILDMDTEKVIYAGGRFDRYRYPAVIPDWPAGETEPRRVEWAPTAGLVFDRETWLKVGGFDAWYGFSWEDIEWCDRAVRRGAVIRVEPHLRVLHEAHRSSGGAFSPERLRQWSRNGTVFMFENAGWRSRLHWFRMELGLILKELRAGWRSAARGRVRGLGQGLLGVIQRRRSAP